MNRTYKSLVREVEQTAADRWIALRTGGIEGALEYARLRAHELELRAQLQRKLEHQAAQRAWVASKKLELAELRARRASARPR